MMRRILMLVVAGCLGAVAASAEYYAYETETGTQAFTDDAERIPARYREQAQKVEDVGIEDYERTSIVLVTPEHTASTREAPERPDSAPVELAGQPDVITIEVNEGISLDLPVGANGGREPVTVETGIFESDERGTVERSVVRRGDEILVEVKKPLFNWIEP